MTALLEIRNLHAEIGGRKILDGLDLIVNEGEIHAIMGPNGSGKSTLSYVLAGKPGYEVTGGEILFNGAISAGDDAGRARRQGCVPGVSVSSGNPRRRHADIPARRVQRAAQEARSRTELSSPDLLKRVREIGKTLGIDAEMLRRPLNVGFSGGEKKRNETLQMVLLQPQLCVLDETDSGLDIDALKVVANGVNQLRSPERGMIVITHYQRLLDYIVPDIVHVLSAGRIVRTGGKELALELEATGYAQYQDEAA